jgi:hypothetical protein
MFEHMYRLTVALIDSIPPATGKLVQTSVCATLNEVKTVTERGQKH